MPSAITPQPGILDIAPYQGGKARLDGVADPVKLSSNENPFGPSPAAIAAAQGTLASLHRYPSTDHGELRAAIGDVYGLDPGRIVCGAGSDEIIGLLCQAYAGPGDEVLQIVSADTRVGGTERHRCGPAEAPAFEVETRWYHMAAPSDAVFTEQIEAGGATLGASLVTYSIAPSGTGSAVTVTVAVSSFVGAEMIGEFRSGWTGGMENLDALVARQTEGSPP